MGDGSHLISNKIYTARAASSIDLHCAILTELPQYKPPCRFPGGVLKLTHGTYLLFKSGKVVINGVRYQPKLDEFTRLTGIRLTDVMLSHCSGYVKVGKLNLPQLHDNIKGSFYEPELHPGLSFKLGNISVIAQFKGTVFFCGCRSIFEAEKVKNDILKLINRSRRY